MLRTDWVRISSRVMVTGKLRFSSLRKIVSVTLVLGSPRMRLTASLSDRPLTAVSSILVIRSLVLRPARKAGVPSIGRHDLDQAVFLRDLDADPDETTGRAFAEFLERLLVEVLGMRVQAGHHAGNGVGDQLLLVDRLDVVALDHAEHRRQLLQFLQRQRRQRAARHGLQRHGRQRAGKYAQ